MKVFVVGRDLHETASLCQRLRWEGHEAVPVENPIFLPKVAPADLVLVSPAALARVARQISRADEPVLVCPIVLLPPKGDSFEHWLPFAWGKHIADPVVRVGELSIDAVKMEATRAGRRLRLTRSEFDLLLTLANNEGAPLSRNAIQRAVWGDDSRSANVVDVHIANLRRKLDRPFGYSLIQTVFGIGYCLAAPEDS